MHGIQFETPTKRPLTYTKDVNAHEIRHEGPNRAQRRRNVFGNKLGVHMWDYLDLPGHKRQFILFVPKKALER